MLVSNDGILFGEIDEMQRLHTRTFELNESPRRIAYQPETKTFALITSRRDTRGKGSRQTNHLRESASTGCSSVTTSEISPIILKNLRIPNFKEGDIMEMFNVLFLDQYTFEVIHCHKFQPYEYALSVCTANLGKSRETYFVVGTAFVLPEETEPKYGRLFVFKNEQGSIRQISDVDVLGAPYSMTSFMDDKIVCTINGTVRVYEMGADNYLNLVCSYFNNIVGLYLIVDKERIYIGDLFRSITTIEYKPETDELKGSTALILLSLIFYFYYRNCSQLFSSMADLFHCT